ncbi:LuxR C-terminal-related transcriptional regulator [soil metagenome]
MGPGEDDRFAATKVRPPLPPDRLVHRQRLLALLDAAVQGPERLVLVSAPAGSGKSTLLASWVDGRQEAVAWFQAEEGDSDPVAFWTYLVRSIAAAHPIDGARLEGLVAGSKGDDLVVVSAFVNELVAVEGGLIIVIDDHHLVADAGVQRGLERFVDLSPPGVTLVIATRFDPPFRLGRLRVRNQMVELRAADLRFDEGEAIALLGPAVLDLERSQVAALCERTEGWAAGLVLAGISMGRAASADDYVTAFRGDDRLVVEYLHEELLAGIGLAERRRLLQVSIVDQLDGDLVDAITGTEDGAAWLRSVASENQLLIALDRAGTFRFHHLLRDLLRLEATTELRAELPELHTRAAEWLELHGQLDAAVAHRITAGDPHAAARILRIRGVELLAAGQIDTLRRLLLQLGDVARTVTWCALLMGWCEFIGGRAALASGWLDDMAAAAPADFDHSVAAPLRMNILLAEGDVSSALTLARSMDDPDRLRSRSAELATAVGATYVWAGRAADARRVLDLAVAKASNDDLRSAWVLALVYRAVVELDAGTRASAAAAASTAIETAERFGLGEYHGIALALAIRGRIAENAEKAADDARRAVALARRASTDLALGYILCLAGDTLLDLGDSAGRPLLDEARMVIHRAVDPGIVGRHLQLAESRHHIASNRPRTAALVEQLTDRELAVLGHLPSGRSQREIADELYVSLNTVKTHCRAIYRKVGATDRRGAVQAARDHGLL